MKRNRTRGGRGVVAVVLCAIAFSMIPYARGDGYRNPPPGGAALGRSGNVVAQGDDATAVYYNPANLVEVPRPTAEVSLSVARTRTEFSAPGRAAASDDPWQVLPNLFYAAPLADRDWALGLGVTTPYGQSVEWDAQSPFRFVSPYFAQMTAINVNPSAAWRVSPNLSLGAGVDIFASTLEFKQMYPWSMALRNPAAPDGIAKVETDGQGVGGNAGLTWKIGERQRLALAYRSPVTVDYDGDLRISGAPPPLDLGRRDFSTRVEFPDIVSAGYGVQVSDRWRVEADVEWLGWSRNKSQPLDSPAYAPLLAQPEIVNNWDDTWTFGIGADYAFAADWVARAGYSFLQSPVPDETFSPVLPDADRHVATLGLGWRHDRHQVDLAVAFSFYADREIRDNLNPALNGDYTIQSDLVGLSYAYAF